MNSCIQSPTFAKAAKQKTCKETTQYPLPYLHIFCTASPRLLRDVIRRAWESGTMAWQERDHPVLLFFLPSATTLCWTRKAKAERGTEIYRASSAASLMQLQSFPRNLGKGHLSSRVFCICLIWKPSLLCADSGYNSPSQGSDKSLTFSALVSLPKPNT